MPEDKEFLDDFNKRYDTLCHCAVIVDRKQRWKYKIAKIIVKKRRHAIIIIKGQKHAFILELYYRLFKGWFFNCPNIRYISDEDVKKMHLSYNTIEKSADELVQQAIETVSKMGDYNVLDNNCQNFAKNYLCALGVKNQEDKLDGEVVKDNIGILLNPIKRLFGWRE